MRRTAARRQAPADSSRTAYVVDDQIGFLLRVATQFHTAIFMSQMVRTLTQTQFAALSKIYEVGVCSQSNLAELLMLDSSTINGVIDRLNARGLLSISQDPSDQRRQRLSLTKEGVRVVGEAEAVAPKITADTLANLTPAEQARLTQLLRKMVGLRAR